MTNKAAQELGRLGGLARSEAKARAARENGAMPCHPGKRRGRPTKKSKAKRPNPTVEGRTAKGQQA